MTLKSTFLLAVMAGAALGASNGYNPPTFITNDLPAGKVGQAYKGEIMMGRNSTKSTVVVVLEPNNMPPGLRLGTPYQRNAFPAPGIATVYPITGTPTKTGSFAVRFEAYEDCDTPATGGNLPLCGAHLGGFSSTSVFRWYTFTIQPGDVGPPKPDPLRIVTSALPGASYGMAYQAALDATGGTGNGRQWTASGTLPPGLSMTGIGLSTGPVTEQIAGCPSTPNTYRLSVTVSENGAGSDTRAFTLTVAQGKPPISVQPQALPDGQESKQYTEVQLHATLGCLTAAQITPVWGAVPGTLPDGMEITPAGVVRGIPKNAGSYTVKVLVADKTNGSATVSVPLTIKNAPPPMTVTLLDPVPLGGSPSMLSGPYVASTPQALGDFNARQVQGISADGFSQLVVRIPTDKVGRQLVVDLVDEHDNPAPARQIGGVATPESIARAVNKPLEAAGTSLVVSSMAGSSGGSFAYVVYVSPPDFDRESPEPGTERSVTLRVKSDAPDGPAYQNRKIRIVRPPVLLVHGMNSDPDAWNEVEPALGTDFQIFRADYGKIVSVLLTEPYNLMQPGDGGTLGVKSSALGFTYNAPIVFKQLQDYLEAFRRGQNRAGIPLAAVQMDVVAHSLGGLVSRRITYLDGYYGPNTLTGGYIHKLITVGTPHRGSPYAKEFSDPDNGCPRIANNTERDAFVVNATVQDEQGVHKVPGAIYELRGTIDGQLACSSTDPNYNEALLAIHRPAAGAFTRPLRTAMLAGVMTSQQLKNLDSIFQRGTFFTGAFALRKLCPGSPLARKLTSATYSQLMGDRSDALVTPLSAHDGMAEGQEYSAVHSPYTALIGFGKPHLLEPSSGVPQRIKELLYTAAGSEAYVPLPLGSPCGGK